MQRTDSFAKRTINKAIVLSDVAFFLAIWSYALCCGEQSWFWLGGLLVSIVAFGLWIVARIQLGKSFSIGAEARALVTTGLYRRFRHPIYLFGAIATLGVLVAIQNWVLGVWLLYVTPIQSSRLRKEEAVLEKTFGNAFRDHRKMTWI